MNAARGADSEGSGTAVERISKVVNPIELIGRSRRRLARVAAIRAAIWRHAAVGGHDPVRAVARYYRAR